MRKTLDVVIPTEFEDLKKLELNKVYEITLFATRGRRPELVQFQPHSITDYRNR